MYKQDYLHDVSREPSTGNAQCILHRFSKCFKIQWFQLSTCKGKFCFESTGTPSLAEPATISAVLCSVNRLCSLDGVAEITLEANPTSVETAKLRFVLPFHNSLKVLTIPIYKKSTSELVFK